MGEDVNVPWLCHTKYRLGSGLMIYAAYEAASAQNEGGRPVSIKKVLTKLRLVLQGEQGGVGFLCPNRMPWLHCR